MFFSFAYRSKGEEALILAHDPSTGTWSAAIGKYSVSGDLESILKDDIWKEVPQYLELLPSECYSDDLMIIDLGGGKYEFQSFALLVDEIGTVEEIVKNISARYLWDASEIFEDINVEEFKPDSMAAKFYAAFQKGGEHA